MGNTTNAGSAPGLQLCMGRPNNILELTLLGVPAEVLDVLFGWTGDARHVERVSAEPVTMTFLTSTSARRSVLTVVGGPDRWSAARFSTVWLASLRPLPSAAAIRDWNECAAAGHKLLLREDGSIIQYMDADLDDITLQQVILIWLSWDYGVEDARQFISSGVV